MKHIKYLSMPGVLFTYDEKKFKGYDNRVNFFFNQIKNNDYDAYDNVAFDQIQGKSAVAGDTTADSSGGA